MDLEVQVAVNFLIGYLVNKLPRRRVQLFSEEVVKKLTKKFEGHWYPEKPCKGSGYRCLLITESLDPVLSSAAKESGLSVKDVKANLPEKLCLWIDPQEVSFRIGELWMRSLILTVNSLNILRVVFLKHRGSSVFPSSSNVSDFCWSFGLISRTSFKKSFERSSECEKSIT